MMVRRCDRCGKKIEGLYTRIHRNSYNQKTSVQLSLFGKENDLCIECERDFIKFMEQPKEGADSEQG